MTSTDDKTISNLNMKLKYLEDQLEKTSFTHPIRQSLVEIRDDILEFCKVFEEDISNMNKLLVSNLFLF